MSSNTRQESKRTFVTKVFMIFVFVVAIILPLLRMLVYMTNANISAIFNNENFLSALSNSLISTLTATVISISAAFVLAFCVYRTNVKHKTIIATLITLPMLIPSLSHGMGLILLFGANGLITNIFKIKSTLYGFTGLVAGSVMYSFPVAFIMLSDILRYQDYTPYEACECLGIMGLDKFKVVTFPYLKKPFLTVFFSIFAMIATDYGVALMVGGKYLTLPVLMYQEVLGLQDFAKGAVIGALLLVPAFIAFVFDSINKTQSVTSFSSKPFPNKTSKLTLILSYYFIAIVILFVILPIFSFVVLSFVTKYPFNLSITAKHIMKTITSGGLVYLKNSLIISLASAIVGTIITYCTAYFTARQKGVSSKILHLVSITTMAIPGLVLGLSYLLFFSGTFLQGTMVLLVLVGSVHFFASPYIMAYNSFCKMNINLESVGKTLGVGKLQLMLDVFIPQMGGTLLEMFSYFFVNGMMTISAVSFLSTALNKPLSLMINYFQAQMIIEAAAFVSLIILIVNITMKLVIYILKKGIFKTC